MAEALENKKLGPAYDGEPYWEVVAGDATMAPPEAQDIGEAILRDVLGPTEEQVAALPPGAALLAEAQGGGAVGTPRAPHDRGPRRVRRRRGRCLHREVGPMIGRLRRKLDESHDRAGGA
jgi:hypothetical protein